jgi:hypothetical protein
MNKITYLIVALTLSGCFGAVAGDQRQQVAEAEEQCTELRGQIIEQRDAVLESGSPQQSLAGHWRCVNQADNTSSFWSVSQSGAEITTMIREGGSAYSADGATDGKKLFWATPQGGAGVMEVRNTGLRGFYIYNTGLACERRPTVCTR